MIQQLILSMLRICRLGKGLGCGGDGSCMELHSSGGGSGKKVVLKGLTSSEGDRGRILVDGA